MKLRSTMRSIGVLLVAALLAACGDTTNSAPSEEAAAEGTETTSEAPDGAPEEIVLGVVLAQSGTFSSAGELILDGAELAVDQLNADGGINGAPVRLEVRDNQSDPQATVSAARELLQSDIVGLIGPESTSLGTGVEPLVNEAQIPEVSLQGGIDLTGDNGYVFGVSITGSAIVKASIEHMKANGITKIGYLTTSDALGQAGDAFGYPLFEESEIEVVERQTIDPAGNDFSTQMRALKDAGAESVFLWASGGPAIVAAKNFDALDMPGNIYLLNLTSAQLEPIGASLEKVRVAQTKPNVWDEITEDDPVYDELKPFIDAAQEAGITIDNYTAGGYSAVMVFADAIRQVGVDPQAIYDLWHGGYSPPNPVGRIAWSEEVHQGLNIEDIVVTKIDPATQDFSIAP